MKLSIGIVGLPNVGKSTLFNALLKKQVALEANYPFATIDPNVGIIEVPDERLPVLANIVNTQKVVPAAVEFYDIAGLVRGASQGEGLGNKFLTHIREVAAVAHVVRLFEDKDIIHVDNKIDPLEDLKTIETELILADLGTVSKYREPRMNASKDEIATYKAVQIVKAELDKGVAVRNVRLSDDDKPLIRQLNLLTAKPVIFCFNCSLEQLDDRVGAEKRAEEILRSASSHPEGDTASYLLFNPLEEETLNVLIKRAYETLGLISFLTAGELEARAWTIARGTPAPAAAGTIHTDFEKKFIKADIVKYDDFVAAPGWVKSRETGRVNTVGKDYIMQDGDVVEFKIGG